MYKVVKYFTDLQDNNHVYHAGDIFPREGVEVSEKRLKELSTKANRRGIPLIAEDEETKAVEPVEETSEVEETEDVTEETEDANEASDETEETEDKPKKKRGRPRNAE